MQYLWPGTLVDDIFWLQALPDLNQQSLLALADDDELKEIFLFNYGPYDRLADNAPVVSVAPKSPGAGFYPHDLTREQLAGYLRTHPEFKYLLESPYTVIRRFNSDLIAIPYHEVYKEQIQAISELLVKASSIESHARFKEYLAQRSKDLKTDDYYASDTFWVRLSGNPIDLVIGPYEVYEDQLMGLKAAYEAILFRRNLEESGIIANIRKELPSLCRSIEKELDSKLHVQETKVELSIGDLIYSGGDARKSIPAIAFTLPNDEKVIEEIGARQIILKNILEVKFRLVAWPILNHLLPRPREGQGATFKKFFNHTIFHEISHAIGPHRITVNGEDTTVNRCLRQYHWVLEEAKADALGACIILSLSDASESNMFLESYIAGFVRPIRFGLGLAHGMANALQFNYFLQEAAFFVDHESRTLSVYPERARIALYNLTSNILHIQERGDFNTAEQFVKKFCVMSSDICAVTDKLLTFPIDIRIRYKKAT